MQYLRFHEHNHRFENERSAGRRRALQHQCTHLLPTFLKLSTYRLTNCSVFRYQPCIDHLPSQYKVCLVSQLLPDSSTQGRNQIVLESQLPRKIVNLLFSSVKMNNMLTILRGSWLSETNRLRRFVRCGRAWRKEPLAPYKGTSLIRNTHPPRITLGPQERGFCRVLQWEFFLWAKYPYTIDSGHHLYTAVEWTRDLVRFPRPRQVRSRNRCHPPPRSCPRPAQIVFLNRPDLRHTSPDSGGPQYKSRTCKERFHPALVLNYASPRQARSRTRRHPPLRFRPHPARRGPDFTWKDFQSKNFLEWKFTTHFF